jgi:hypothetical protein
MTVARAHEMVGSRFNVVAVGKLDAIDAFDAVVLHCDNARRALFIIDREPDQILRDDIANGNRTIRSRNQ